VSDFDPYDVALIVTRALDAVGASHTVGGSIASSFAGEPRSTLDIDVVASLSEDAVEPFMRLVEGDFYLDEDALRRAIRSHTSTNLIHHGSLLKIDLFIAGGTPIDEEQIARRRKVTLTDGRILHIHPPEDILLQKLRWFRLGGGVPDRQWRDITAIVRVQGSRLEREYLSRQAGTLGVTDLLERALSEE
jgi:hypothetical protein